MLFGVWKDPHGSTRAFNFSAYEIQQPGGTPAPPWKNLHQPFSLCANAPRDVSLPSFYYIILFFALYSLLGLTKFRHSRSPRSKAVISTSAVAILVATGML